MKALSNRAMQEEVKAPSAFRRQLKMQDSEALIPRESAFSQIANSEKFECIICYGQQKTKFKSIYCSNKHFVCMKWVSYYLY